MTQAKPSGRRPTLLNLRVLMVLAHGPFAMANPSLFELRSVSYAKKPAVAAQSLVTLKPMSPHWQ